MRNITAGPARNREALMPEIADALAARDASRNCAPRPRADHHRLCPTPTISRATRSPCMNGWGRQSLNVTPRGSCCPAMPRKTIPGLSFWSVREHRCRYLAGFLHLRRLSRDGLDE